MLLYSNSIRSNNSNHPMIFLWKSTNCKTPPNHPDSEVQVGQTLDQLSPKTRWHTGRHWTLSQPLDFWSIIMNESQLEIRQVSRLASHTTFLTVYLLYSSMNLLHSATNLYIDTWKHLHVLSWLLPGTGRWVYISKSP